MALTASTMLPLGTSAPPFTLTNVVTNKQETLDEHLGTTGTLVIFMCNHCPYVIHLIDSLVAFTKKNHGLGINTIAISSNDVERYPEDHPDRMKMLALEKSFGFPYLYDEDQQVAKIYDAACTPDFYLFDASKKLVYRGRYDESRPGNDRPINGDDLQTAINALISGGAISDQQYPSMGCGIKWKTD